MVKRSSINMNLYNANDEGQFIDIIRGTAQFGAPGGATWKTGDVWMQKINANGWPTYQGTKTAGFGGFRIPPSANFAGPYTIDGRGTGRISISHGTWTLGAATGVTQQSNGIYNVTDSGSGWTMQLTYDGAVTIQMGLNILINDTGSTGSYIRNVRFYRTEDAADLAAGKIFRRPWKQALADLNPLSIRIMNWTGSSNSKICRFENRTKPNYASWQPTHFDWATSLPYGEASGTNQYSLAAVTGTPASMQHGEMATCRIANGFVRVGNKTVTNITTAANGRATSTAHGYNTGDKIVHIFSTISRVGTTTSGNATITSTTNTGIVVGMQVNSIYFPVGSTVVSTTATTITISSVALSSITNDTIQYQPCPRLHYLPCTITVIDTDTYDINVNTSTFSAFANTSNTAISNQFITLQVGSGNDRTAYPVVFPDAVVLASHYGTGYIATGDYKTFYFDKNQSVQKDASGNWVYGLWTFPDNGADMGHWGGTPYEAGSALINELMEMTRSDGGVVGPIDLWTCVPHWALLSMDPDYSAASNPAIGMVDVMLNGSTVDGVTYAGLNSACKLYVEFSNETWNTASGFYASSYTMRLGFLRWGGANADVSSMHSLRSMIMVQDVLGASQAFPRARLKFIMAGQGTLGVASTNLARMDGSSYVLTDPLNVGGVTPMSLHDYFAWAAYLVITGTWETVNLAAIVASWVSHAGDAVAQEADCAAYVAGFENTGISGNETVYRYRDILLPAYAAGLTSRGKQTMMYEGGWDRSVTNGSADQNSFMAAVKKSRAWANKLVGFYNRFDTTTDALGPHDYIQYDPRWGHLYGSPYTDAVNNVEWSGLDLAWKLAALRNCDKRQWLVKT